MNKDQVQGRVDRTVGAVKEMAGKAVGNERLTSEGQAEQAVGKVQASYGDAKEDVKNHAKKLIDKL
jgi:uncharacterized protein YjbJ (UPF0337 family)